MRHASDQPEIIYPRRYLYRYALPSILIVGVFLSGIYMLSAPSENLNETIHRVIHGLIMTAGLWTGCILIVTWLWKKYPWQESPVKHLLYEIILILFFTAGFSSLVYFAEKKIFNHSIEIILVYDAFTTLLITYFITAIHEAVFFYRQWRLHFSKSVKLERDNIEANYEALKNQVNPHFLFNSLNSLTGVVDDNPEAVRYIANLSDFLRYLLKSSENELVILHEELEIVKKYLDLQKSRFGDALEIEIQVTPDAYQKYLPPLVIQMLTENCIKHNIVSLDEPLRIKIISKGEKLIVENNLLPKKGIISTGKGLKNIMNRYSLFTSVPIEIIKEKSFFRVIIPLLTSIK